MALAMIEGPDGFVFSLARSRHFSGATEGNLKVSDRVVPWLGQQLGVGSVKVSNMHVTKRVEVEMGGRSLGTFTTSMHGLQRSELAHGPVRYRLAAAISSVGSHLNGSVQLDTTPLPAPSEVAAGAAAAPRGEGAPFSRAMDASVRATTVLLEVRARVNLSAAVLAFLACWFPAAHA
eukprot:TRINITY_DN4132_c0_g1_i2.p2 TRINITY_DN4132_c0_g1~~TRINITY_DN4132_c0_g1_i2.p2  ORF type:complete len:177 (-),score=46.71 TRINITY_DN4132_c0_g1_i2:492-1022(-)